MLQEHGLGARPYDCSKCTLKFFFRAELDHHVLTFHHPGEASSPVENVHNSIETSSRDTKQRNNDEESIIVKEEVLPDTAEEEEEINVDEQVEQDDHKSDELGETEQELKVEIEEEPAAVQTES